MYEARMDAIIARYMRCAGYTPQEVTNELYRHTLPAPRGRTITKGQSAGVKWSGMSFDTAEYIDITRIKFSPEHIPELINEMELKKTLTRI